MIPALTKCVDERNARSIKGGRRADSRKLARAGSLPSVSPRLLYTKTENRAELRSAKASTLKVEAE